MLIFHKFEIENDTIIILLRSASCTAVVSPLGPTMTSTHVSLTKSKNDVFHLTLTI